MRQQKENSGTYSHRHVDLLVGLQSLLFEAKTLNLVEVDARLNERRGSTGMVDTRVVIRNKMMANGCELKVSRRKKLSPSAIVASSLPS